MEVVYEQCCGLDVHKRSVVGCIITPRGKETRTFGTVTKEIRALAEWIKQNGCTHVAMESTSVYWKPIYNLLEMEGMEVLVVNARHIKAVPGRKTDVKDAEWIADLLRHGLMKGSFISDRDHREIRELVRYRRSIVNERAREVNRLQKVLEGCNIKLASVARDVMGVSGRSMIEALINGIEDVEVLSGYARGSMKSKRQQFEDALCGLIGNHQKMLLSVQLQHIDYLDQQISGLDREVAERLRPFEKKLELLDTIPGIGRRTAEQVIAETGTDMNQFPSAAHLSSWAGMAPGNNESAGKRKSGRTTKGSKALRSTLVDAAHAAAHTKGTYLSTQFHKISARRGSKRAAVAVGHTILVIVYNMLKKKEPYSELGPDYLDQRRKQSVTNRAVKKLEALGYRVSLEDVVA